MGILTGRRRFNLICQHKCGVSLYMDVVSAGVARGVEGKVIVPYIEAAYAASIHIQPLVCPSSFLKFPFDKALAHCYSISMHEQSTNVFRKGWCFILKRLFILLMAIMLLIPLAAGCGTDTSTTGSSGGDTIKVGLNYELSNDLAQYGQASVEGIELAVEEINKAGGVLGKEIELIKQDNKSDPAEATNVATKLAKDKVVAILGPATSGNVKAVRPVVTENKIPLISGSATADDVTVTENGVAEYIFRTCFNDSFQGGSMAKFAVDELNAKTAVMYVETTSDYSKGLAASFKDVFTSNGGQILAEEYYQGKDKDFRSVLTKLKGYNADVIYVPGYYNEVGLIIKQAREMGITAPILGGDGFDSNVVPQEAGAAALTDVYFTNHYSADDTDQKVVDFRKAFNAKYNKDPNAFHASGYDEMYFLADAIKRANSTDPVKIKDALASTKDFKAVTGTLSIDENHNPVKSVVIVQWKGDKQEFVTRIEP
ncbi:MAG: branched-chain amino acid transport system substrate-binding protein [Clostridiales bacterium]|nr:branched-chain amino acid transport system substrate-binding protein [Clostridiales bacterium]MDK2992222.1 branched-chain amino acid transport system substrate-binding protein [Clostridiales bacterium]